MKIACTANSILWSLIAYSLLLLQITQYAIKIKVNKTSCNVAFEANVSM